MKNKIRLLGIIALATVIGFAACDNDTPPESGTLPPVSTRYSFTLATDDDYYTVEIDTTTTVDKSARAAISVGTYRYRIYGSDLNEIGSGTVTVNEAASKELAFNFSGNNLNNLELKVENANTDTATVKSNPGVITTASGSITIKAVAIEQSSATNTTDILRVLAGTWTRPSQGDTLVINGNTYKYTMVYPTGSHTETGSFSYSVFDDSYLTGNLTRGHYVPGYSYGPPKAFLTVKINNDTSMTFIGAHAKAMEIDGTFSKTL